MKSKYWIMIFGAILAVCLVLVFIPADDTPALRAQIRSEDSVVIVDLLQPQELVFDTADGGYNIVTVKGGKIAVTEANCPDQYCVRQGFCNSGEQIVCLPHKLVISFMGESEIDGAVG
jgi:hypothetical protein